MRRLTITTAAISLALVGCSSTPKPGTPEAVAYAEEIRTETLTDAVEEGLDALPDWCMDVPKEDYAIFACGIGASQDINMSRTRAELEAKRQLADRIAGTVSSQIKQFQESIGAGLDEQVVEQITVVTKSLATDVDLTGYTTAEMEIVAAGPRYMTDTLLEYPIGEVNRLMVEKVKQNEVLNTRIAASDAFAELEREIQAARKDKDSSSSTKVFTIDNPAENLANQ